MGKTKRYHVGTIEPDYNLPKGHEFGKGRGTRILRDKRSKRGKERQAIKNELRGY